MCHSSTEAEYVCLSDALRQAIPLMELVKELKAAGFKIYSETTRVFCKAFEDNSGALELARLPKIRPRTRHINVSYHHFRDWVRRREILLYPISTLQQLGDILTKLLSPRLFITFRNAIQGWTQDRSQGNEGV